MDTIHFFFILSSRNRLKCPRSHAGKKLTPPQLPPQLPQRPLPPHAAASTASAAGRCRGRRRRPRRPPPPCGSIEPLLVQHLFRALKKHRAMAAAAMAPTAAAASRGRSPSSIAAHRRCGRQRPPRLLAVRLRRAAAGGAPGPCQGQTENLLKPGVSGAWNQNPISDKRDGFWFYHGEPPEIGFWFRKPPETRRGK